MSIHDHAITAEIPVGLAPASGDGPFRCSPAVLPGLALGLDVFAIAASGWVSLLALPGHAAGPMDVQRLGILVMAAVAPALIQRGGLYRLGAITGRPLPVEGIGRAVVGGILAYLASAYLLGVAEAVALGWVLGFAALAGLALAAGRVLLCQGSHALHRRGIIGRTLVVLGDGEQAHHFLTRAARALPPLTRLGGVFLTLPDGCGAGFPAGPEALVEAARAGRADDVVIALPWHERERLSRTIERLEELPVSVWLASELADGPRLRPVAAEAGAVPLFEVSRRPLAGWPAVAKRAEDLLLGGLLFVATAPLLVLIAAAIRLDSPGPVIFRQQRLGFNNRVFTIYKFRSMHHRPGERSPAFEPQATRGDPRVTRVGRLLRRTSLDELPQLLNVLEGSMSLVGPRPHALGHNAEYGRRIRGYFARHNVKPGITGWAQVHGLRGETARLGQMQDRVRHDRYYAENWSLTLDLKILLMTALVLPFQRSAY